MGSISADHDGINSYRGPQVHDAREASRWVSPALNSSYGLAASARAGASNCMRQRWLSPRYHNVPFGEPSNGDVIRHREFRCTAARKS